MLLLTILAYKLNFFQLILQLSVQLLAYYSIFAKRTLHALTHPILDAVLTKAILTITTLLWFDYNVKTNSANEELLEFFF